MTRHVPPYRTPSGILIGSAYCPPPAPMSADAELIQGILLKKQEDKHMYDQVWFLVSLLCCGAAGLIITVLT